MVPRGVQVFVEDAFGRTKRVALLHDPLILLVFVDKSEYEHLAEVRNSKLIFEFICCQFDQDVVFIAQEEHVMECLGIILYQIN